MTDTIVLILSFIIALLLGFTYWQWRALTSLSTQKKQLEQQLSDRERNLTELISRAEMAEKALSETQALVSEREHQLAELNEQAKITAAEIAQSKALFNTTNSVAYDLVFVLDDEGHIIALNDSARAFFGNQLPIGEKLSAMIASPELDHILDNALLNHEEILEEQLIINGRYYRARTQFSKYDNQHLFIGVALQDITQLVRLNRARRDLVANISHELRTPIANIRLIIDSLFHEQDKPKRKDSISSLKAIANETDTLLWLVQELLDLSMIESGQSIMKMTEVQIAEVVDNAIARLEDQLANKRLRVVRNFNHDVRVLCDTDQTKRVLVNLLHNAIKWSPKDGVITITVTPGAEDVTISVFDQGPGVPDEQCERIFERFYQVDASRSGGEGTGLGLAICKHIVEAQGGRIWAEGNSHGPGGRFLFTLLNAKMPIKTEAETTQEKEFSQF